MPVQHEIYDVGDQPRLSAAFALVGVATDPTAVKFKYRTPAGVETELVHGVDGALVKDGTGNYHVDLTLSAAGTWLIRWVGSGACTSASEFSLKVQASQFTDPD